MTLAQSLEAAARDLEGDRDALLHVRTAGDLAALLDPLTVQTPALGLIDELLLGVRDAVDTMMQRRREFARLVRMGVEKDDAIVRAAAVADDVGIMRLMLSTPPQEGKSERISRHGVTWLLRQFPGLRGGIISYDGGNASTFSYKIRSDIQTFDGSSGNIDLGLRLMKDSAAVSRFRLTNGCSIYAIGIGGGLTGRPLDYAIIDDPVKDEKWADSELMLQQTWDWYQTVFRPRLAPWAPVVIVQTRWDERDLTGRLITKQREDEESGAPNFDKWHRVNIPAEADHDPNKGEVDILGRDVGEFLVSARGRTRELWEATKVGTAARFWNAMYQGRPAPSTGAVWEKPWWRWYSDAIWAESEDGGHFLVPREWELRQSWDLAFTDTKGSDFVAGGVFAKRGAETRVLYLRARRLSFTDTVAEMRRVKRLFPQTSAIYIEKKANGHAVINTLQREVEGLIGSSPDWANKVRRAELTSPYIRAGNVLLPSPEVVAMMPSSIAWDPDDFIEEATSFPRGQHDDRVDVVSQYLGEVYGRGAEVVIATGSERLPDTHGRGGQPKRPSSLSLPKGMSPMQERLTRRALGGGRVATGERSDPRSVEDSNG